MCADNAFAGQVGVVTGAGSGIGLATAVALASHGATVVVTELPARMAAADAVVERIRKDGGQAIAVPLDVKQTLTIPGVIARVADQFGRIDVLVNNAGVTVIKPASAIEPWEFDHVIDVNLKGAFFCAQAVGAVMRVQQGGAIVSIASQHGVVANLDRSPYCASKAGLIHLSKALALEWAPHRIRVNCVSPTFVDNLHNTALLAEGAIADEIRTRTPLGRAATAQEVASAVCFLASRQSAMITGHNLVVDGGWTIQ